MNSKKITSFYSEHFASHEKRIAQDPEKNREREHEALEAMRTHLSKVIEKHPQGKFLDLGCDDGLKTEIVAQIAGAEAHGVDIVERRVKTAQERGIKAQIIDPDWERLSYNDEAFDFVFCNDVIEHVFSPDHLLEEMSRLTKKGGYVIIETANLASWKNRLMLMIGWQPYFTEVSTIYRVGNPRVPQNPPAGHIRVFTLRALKELSEKYGYTVEKVVGEGTGGRSPLGRAAGIIDAIILHFFPGLADLIIVKLRKP